MIAVAIIAIAISPKSLFLVFMLNFSLISRFLRFFLVFWLFFAIFDFNVWGGI